MGGILILVDEAIESSRFYGEKTFNKLWEYEIFDRVKKLVIL